jgi:cobalt-zinc-cadmium efflux system protein
MMSGHPPAPQSAAFKDRKRLAMVLVIGIGILVMEVIGALLTDSLALLADAGHVAGDVAGVALAMGAIWLAARPPSDTRTYGWYRAEILAATINSVVLLMLAAFILWQAWGRLFSSPDVASGPMLVIALIGAAGNAVSLRLLHDAQTRSLNMRGAYLEVLGDLFGSVAVVVAAAVMLLSGFTAADAIASAVIAILIVPRAWHLLREAVDVLLQATPRGLDMDEVRRHLLETPGVEDVHDLHAWTLTGGLPVLSAHVVVNESVSSVKVLDELCGCLVGDFDVEHSTIQLETRDRSRQEQQAHS